MLVREVEEFLFLEARLLDERRFDDGRVERSAHDLDAGGGDLDLAAA